MMRRFVLLGIMLTFSVLKGTTASEVAEITPYKFTSKDKGMPSYTIPASSRFTIARKRQNAPQIVYYFSKPKKGSYPLAILCGGSSSKGDIGSIIHFHRYFLGEFVGLGAAVLTVEQEGLDGPQVNEDVFLAHYTRSERLKDHQAVIEHLKANPPKGWNGKLIFLGVSEGGPIVTALTTAYPEMTLATINWSGAGDWSWREQLWVFLQQLHVENPECPHHAKLRDCAICLKDVTSRKQYDARMDAMLQDSTAERYFFNMTHKYHADALSFPKLAYAKIRTPFLVVTGTKDPLIPSSDAFVQASKEAGTPVTYLRVEDMDHFVRKRPDVIQKSFKWLEKILEGKE